MFCIVKFTLEIFLGNWHCKMFFFCSGYHCRRYKIIVDAKSEKEAKLEYKLQLIVKEFFKVILSVQLLAANDSHISSL